MHEFDRHGSKSLTIITVLLSWVVLVVQCYYVFSALYLVNVQASIFILLFSIATAFLLTARRINEKLLPFSLIFLLSTFTMIASWRISVLANMPVVSYIFLVMLAAKLLNYLVTAYRDIKDSRQTADKKIHHIAAFEWQLLFIRMAIGFDLVPHFCEKLFSGPAARVLDVQAFTKLGVSHAAVFVLIAGLIEFGGALSLSCGFLTRVGSIGLFVYLMVASYLGQHFSLGFIWASPGGGWEFPVLWSVLVISFAVFGSATFSVDGYLTDSYKLPQWIKFLMGTRVTQSRSG